MQDAKLAEIEFADVGQMIGSGGDYRYFVKRVVVRYSYEGFWVFVSGRCPVYSSCKRVLVFSTIKYPNILLCGSGAYIHVENTINWLVALAVLRAKCLCNCDVIDER